MNRWRAILVAAAVLAALPAPARAFCEIDRAAPNKKKSGTTLRHFFLAHAVKGGSTLGEAFKRYVTDAKLQAHGSTTVYNAITAMEALAFWDPGRQAALNHIQTAINTWRGAHPDTKVQKVSRKAIDALEQVVKDLLLDYKNVTCNYQYQNLGFRPTVTCAMAAQDLQNWSAVQKHRDRLAEAIALYARLVTDMLEGAQRDMTASGQPALNQQQWAARVKSQGQIVFNSEASEEEYNAVLNNRFGGQDAADEYLKTRPKAALLATSCPKKARALADIRKWLAAPVKSKINQLWMDSNHDKYEAALHGVLNTAFAAKDLQDALAIRTAAVTRLQTLQVNPAQLALPNDRATRLIKERVQDSGTLNRELNRLNGNLTGLANASPLHKYIQADTTIRTKAAAGTNLTAQDLKDINALNSTKSPGVFRTSVAEESSVPQPYWGWWMPPASAPTEVNAILQWLSTELGGQHPNHIAIAGKAYAWCVSVHPFADGNGRTCKFLADYALVRGGLPPGVWSANPGVFPVAALHGTVNAADKMAEIIAAASAAVTDAMDVIDPPPPPKDEELPQFPDDVESSLDD